MEERFSIPSNSRTTKLTDLNEDSLAHCSNYLSLSDIANLAITCKSLKRLAYSDSLWILRFRERWPRHVATSSLREAYLANIAALNRFQFSDPLAAEFITEPRPVDHILLDEDHIIFSQGSAVQTVKITTFLDGKDPFTNLNDHNARISCMRTFPISETYLYRSESQRKENILITSSYDHSIRLWWKGSCQRCFRGHNGPVSTLSDKLLGHSGAKILASGGQDGTARLWSLSSSQKRGLQSLKATLHGHQKPIKLMSVSGHRNSLLVTISSDSKVRLWDTTIASAAKSSCCVGMASLPGAPVAMNCHESLLYVATDSSVIALDLRTMQKVVTAAIHGPKLCSFAIMPSKSLICTGGQRTAMLWDIRRNQDTMKLEQIAELEGHTSPVTLLHMDPYKIVTGGPKDLCVNVWDTGTGMQTNSLMTCSPEVAATSFGCSAMALNGTQIVTATCGELGSIFFRDYNNASCPVSLHEYESGTKFWNPPSDFDGDSMDS